MVRSFCRLQRRLAYNRTYEDAYSQKFTEGMRMKLLIGLVEVACLSILCLAQQSSQPARPGPEIAKMAVYAGQWRYEGESEPGPSGPADRYSGYAIGKLILNGFYFEWR